MNGRAYDYNLGRFLSVDPIIQFPANSQSLNPYSYIMNNPLSGTDPSGFVACSSSDGASGDCGVDVGGATWEGQGDTRSVNKTSNRSGTFNTTYTASGTGDATVIRTQTGGQNHTYVLSNGSNGTSTIAGSGNANETGSPSESGKSEKTNKRVVSSGTFTALSEQEQQGYFDQLVAGTPRMYGSDNASQLAYESIGTMQQEIMQRDFAAGQITENQLNDFYKFQAVGAGFGAVGGAALLYFLAPSTAASSVIIGSKIAKQMGPRGWTQESITKAMKSGNRIKAKNKANGNPATRYVHPKNGKSVVVDDVTNEVIQVGGPGFRFGPRSGDLP